MKKNNKGFTLAEMLIVVAIIGVLIAILVPTFTAQLRKAQVAASQANIRSKISEITAQALMEGSTSGSGTADIKYGLEEAEVLAIGGVKSGVKLNAGTVYIEISDGGATITQSSAKSNTSGTTSGSTSGTTSGSN